MLYGKGYANTLLTASLPSDNDVSDDDDDDDDDDDSDDGDLQKYQQCPV